MSIHFFICKILWNLDTSQVLLMKIWWLNYDVHKYKIHLGNSLKYLIDIFKNIDYMLNTSIQYNSLDRSL